jgi:hypothetical protein
MHHAVYCRFYVPQNHEQSIIGEMKDSTSLSNCEPEVFLSKPASSTIRSFTLMV